MKVVGLHCVTVYGEREDCIASFLCRERQTGRMRGKASWQESNWWWYDQQLFTQSEVGGYVIQAFNDGHHRPVEEVFAEIQRRVGELRTGD